MIHRYTIISDEVEDFIREIKIDGDATFQDLHDIILQSCEYENNQITSFHLCNEEWEKQLEIVLEDMGTSAADEDVYIMRETRLSDMIEDEKQRLIYIFDPLTERAFYMELTEIIYGQDLDKAVCSRQHGEPPAQLPDLDTLLGNKEPVKRSALDMDEDFYGSEGFDSEEFDPEGFEISENQPFD